MAGTGKQFIVDNSVDIVDIVDNSVDNSVDIVDNLLIK